VKNINLEIFRGDSKNYKLILTDNSGNPIDLTGKTVIFTVKKSENDDDSNAKIQKVITTHTDPVNGKTEISLLPDDTELEPDTYIFDIQLSDNQFVHTVVTGRFIVKADITRRRL